jgi:2-polyprenyl-3-methyl-5-hydroxy-6-metoxy-1,4-benzoquinol methylase
MKTIDFERRRDAFVERMLRSTRGTFEIFTIYVGHMLGYYTALAGTEGLTVAELAAQTGTHDRYVREWLEQQASVGILDVAEEEAGGGARRFRLPPAHAEVLADPESLNYLAPMAQIVVGAALPIGRVLEAYRRGTGVPYGDYGADLREGQASLNRAMFLKSLGTDWLPAIPDLHARLQAEPAARIADFGCGLGWSSIGLARTYPKVTVDGFDLDRPSVEAARDNAREAGLADRVRFHLRDASDEELKGRYDLVTAFECVHDMADPVGALRTMLGLVGESGSVLIMDERVAESFAPRGSEVEQIFYGFSVLHCLPVGLSEQPSAGTGTVMRPDTLKHYAAQAGFCDVEILPIDNHFFRFYRLRPLCRAA